MHIECVQLTDQHVLQTMYVAEWTSEGGWKGEMRPYGPLHLEPAAQVSSVGHTLVLSCALTMCQVPPDSLASELGNWHNSVRGLFMAVLLQMLHPHLQVRKVRSHAASSSC